MENQLLQQVKEYIEVVEQQIDGEWGTGRSIAQLLEDEDMPSIYYRICDLINRGSVKKQESIDLYLKLKQKQLSSGDGAETYTSGYRNGHLNGQVELLEKLLEIDIDTGLRSEEK